MKRNIVQKRNRLLSIVAVCLTAAITVFGFQNCGKVGLASSQSANESSSSTGTGGTGGVPGSGGSSAVAINLSQPPSQSANLGTTLTIPITVTAPANYSGTLDLTVLTPELKLLDPGKGITFSFSPATLALSSGGSAVSTLTVNVTTLAPSFSLSMFHVQAADSNNASIVGQVTVPLQVKAVFEVYVYGPMTVGKASPEKWSTPVGQITGFISHPEGVSISFINMDTEEHRIHSGGGPILHEGSPGLSPSPDGTAAGGTYTTLVPAGTAKVTSQTYCHDHEGGAQIRTWQFNVPVVAAAPTPSGNPNATFTFVNANVIQPKCIACHSAANAQSGVDLSTYAKVLTFLKVGDPSVSAMYNSVAGPTAEMPEGGPLLAPALVQDISDWINDGAKNN